MEPISKDVEAISSGEAIKLLRESKGWSIEDLANQCDLQAKKLELIEDQFLELGRNCAEKLGLALNVHPGVIMFPQYER